MIAKKISSSKNPEIKQLIKLQEKSRERKKTGLFVIEGLREISLAIQGAYQVQKLFFVPSIITLDTIQKKINTKIACVEINKEVYERMAYRGSTEGVIAVVKSKDHLLDSLVIASKNPLILVTESPEKPGNLGALLRTADAAGIDAVIIANPKADIYNSNCIRSSVGCVFTNQIAEGSTKEVITFLKNNNITIFSAILSDDTENYLSQDFTTATALVVGTEATGLTQDWFQLSDKKIRIPMNGKIDSMNVSVAAGILLFEAVRQRNDSL